MSKKTTNKTSSPQDSHYAKLRRNYRDRNKSTNVLEKKKELQNSKNQLSSQKDPLFLYGIHTVRKALNNPKRKIFQLLATRNALTRLNWKEDSSHPFPIKIVSPKEIDRIVGKETTHQGVALETRSLYSSELSVIENCQLLIVLDQVNDPHNIGAIMRSAVAFGCGGIITTRRYSPNESAVLAKSASGALELIPYIQIGNLTDTLKQIHLLGFQTIGLDSKSDTPLEKAFQNNKIALVFGSEGKGLRQKTQETLNTMARLDMPGAIKSLNVSNAAAIALYTVHTHLKRTLL
ncbi:TrmH family RNA methyltransferase [Candidatus Liberibacter sp.]|uniref:TrmH family RNA methyltransferase n=1 Tax=Candidatus Liberibacter sp. TaxID=34022 RepID=UPI0038F7A1C9